MKLRISLLFGVIVVLSSLLVPLQTMAQVEEYDLLGAAKPVYYTGSIVSLALGGVELGTTVGFYFADKAIYEEYNNASDTESIDDPISRIGLIGGITGTILFDFLPGIGMIFEYRNLQQFPTHPEYFMDFRFPFLLFAGLSLTIRGGISLAASLIGYTTTTAMISSLRAELRDSPEPDIEQLLNELERQLHVSFAISMILSAGYLVPGIFLLNRRSHLKRYMFDALRVQFNIVPMFDGAQAQATIRF